MEYSYQGETKGTVRVIGSNLPISWKVGREIAVFIKGKMLERALKEMKEVSELKRAIPYLRYKRSMPHRKGSIMVGKFPVAASGVIISLLNSVKANADNLAMDTENLQIIHAACQHGPIAFHYGRHRGVHRKLAHFEIVAKEAEEKKVEKKVKDKK